VKTAIGQKGSWTDRAAPKTPCYDKAYLDNMMNRYNQTVPEWMMHLLKPIVAQGAFPPADMPEHVVENIALTVTLGSTKLSQAKQETATHGLDDNWLHGQIGSPLPTETVEYFDKNGDQKQLKPQDISANNPVFLYRDVEGKLGKKIKNAVYEIDAFTSTLLGATGSYGPEDNHFVKGSAYICAARTMMVKDVGKPQFEQSLQRGEGIWGIKLRPHHDDTFLRFSDPFESPKNMQVIVYAPDARLPQKGVYTNINLDPQKGMARLTASNVPKQMIPAQVQDDLVLPNYYQQVSNARYAMYFRALRNVMLYNHGLIKLDGHGLLAGNNPEKYNLLGISNHAATGYARSAPRMIADIIEFTGQPKPFLFSYEGFYDQLIHSICGEDGKNLFIRDGEMLSRYPFDMTGDSGRMTANSSRNELRHTLYNIVHQNRGTTDPKLCADALRQFSQAVNDS